MISKDSKIFVAGHGGLIGSAVARRLRREGYDNLLLADRAALELTDGLAVDRYFAFHQPNYVILAAGKVGGIIENRSFPADFMNANLAIQLNVLKAAHRVDVRKLIFFGSSCMYPRECEQPMAEGQLLSGHPEPTSLAYAVSKLAGLHMCLAYNQQYGKQRFIPLIPNSVFGPNDNFDPKSGHVLSALVTRFHEARITGAASVTLWGSGSPRREFIYSDDVATACLALLNDEVDDIALPLNVGTGQDCSIRELAETVAEVVGFEGETLWDRTKPDGAPRKLLDSARIRRLDWQPMVTLREGIERTYRWFLENVREAGEDCGR